MPSVDGSSTSDTGWLGKHKQKLAGYADNIRVCIENSEWEKLSITLESRQAYLEQLLTGPIPKEYLGDIKQLAESIVEQDQAFKAVVEKQKNISLQSQLTLERGRRAVQRYNES